MKWYHKVSPEWLIARKSFLTASEIKRLLPITATGRKRNTDQAFLEVWAEKQANVTDDDIESYGVMARGHHLEPWAISASNKANAMPAKLHHWDDALVFDKATRIAYSPDALSIEQSEQYDSVTIDAESITHPLFLGEVKCYSPKAHYATAFADRMELEERWQIATAFAVSPTLEQARLILFNPNVQHKLFEHWYTRTDLDAEIELIKDTAAKYFYETRSFYGDAMEIELPCEYTEKEICVEIMRQQELEAQQEHTLNP